MVQKCGHILCIWQILLPLEKTGAAPQQRPRWMAADRGGSGERLCRVAAQLVADATPPQQPTAAAGGLSSAQLADFVKTGFLHLPLADVSSEVHASIYAEAEDLWHRSGRRFGAGLGNNCLPALPRVAEIVRSPSVTGALEKILGHDYALYAHRFLHESGAYESGPQSWHRDAVPQGARPRWCMLCYYPAGASDEQGPTAVLPSSHVMGIDNDPDRVSQVPNFIEGRMNDDGSEGSGTARISPLLAEHRLTSPAFEGFAVIIHSDILHRGMPRRAEVSDSNPWRPMIKLQFVRTTEPIPCPMPTVDWTAGLGLADGEVPGMSSVWQSTWEWLHGQSQQHQPASADDVRVAVQELHEAPRIGGEPERVAAASRLGRMASAGDPAAGVALADALADVNSECLRRAARVGFLSAGPSAGGLAAPLCLHESNLVSRIAVEAVAECYASVREAGREDGDLSSCCWREVIDTIGATIARQQQLLASEQPTLLCGAGSCWDVMAGCAKALGLVAGRCEPGGDTACCAALLDLLQGLLSSEGPDELPGDTEPPPVRSR